MVVGPVVEWPQRRPFAPPWMVEFRHGEWPKRQRGTTEVLLVQFRKMKQIESTLERCPPT